MYNQKKTVLNDAAADSGQGRGEGKSHMKTIRYALPILMMLLVLSACGTPEARQADVRAHDGVIDISQIDLDEIETIRLDGDWSFYSGQIIDPGGFETAVPTGYYNVPEYWTKYAGLNLPAKMDATYRLVIHTDEDSRALSIRTPEIYTEYALWINGISVERTGSFADRTIRYLHPEVYDFDTDGQDVEIVLQIRNDVHANAGIGQSLRLGTPQSIQRSSGFGAAGDLIIITFCVSAGLYHLVYFLFRRKDIEFLYFSILCVASAIRTLFSNETLIMRVLPELAFSMGSRILTLTVPVIVLSSLLYTYNLFRDDAPKVAAIALFSVSGLYALMVLTLPPSIYSSVFYIYLVTLLADFAFAIYVSATAMVRKRSAAVYYVIGSAFLIVGGVIDSLAFNQALQSMYVLSLCLCVFIVAQTALLAKRYSDGHRQVEKLSDNLEASHEQLMITETAFLNAQMKPHFVYNALNTIAECCLTDPYEAEHLILSLSSYLRGTLDFENLGGVIPLKKEIELVRAYVSIERARFDNISVDFYIDTGIDAVLLPPLTLQPLVENAIKHGVRKMERGGSVAVRIRQQTGRIVFEVADNGIGFGDKDPDSVLMGPSANSGVGLYNIHTRLTRYFGSGLSIRSNPGEGTLISFEIPFKEHN